MIKNVIKEDSPKVLQDGIGTPYLAVFNGVTGQAIMDDQNNLPIGALMTSFNYDFDDEDDHMGQFQLDTDNPDLAAIPELDFNAPLVIQWGWIYSSREAFCSPIRRVVVVGKEVNFDSSGTHITIKFSSASVLMKTQQASYTDYTQSMLEYLLDLLEKDMIPGGEILFGYHEERRDVPVLVELLNRLDQDETPTNLEITNPSIYQGKANAVYYLTQKAGKIYPDLYETKVFVLNKENAKLVLEDPDKYLTADLKNVLIGTAKAMTLTDMTPYSRVSTYLKYAPTKWYIEGKDNGLFIHKAFTDRSISKVYTYAGGNWELLKFSVSSDYSLNTTSVINSSDIDDDDNLEVDQTQGNNTGSNGQPNVDSTEYWLFRAGDCQGRNEGYDPIHDTVIRDSDPTGFGWDGSKNDYDKIRGHEGNTTIVNQTETQETRDPELLTYSSAAEAKASLSSTAFKTLTREEIEEWWNEFANEFANEINIEDLNSDEAIADLIHYGLTIPDLKVKRKVRIEQKVNPAIFLRIGDSEHFSEKLLTGEEDPISYWEKYCSHFLQFADVRMGLVGNGNRYQKAIGAIGEYSFIDITSENNDWNDNLHNGGSTPVAEYSAYNSQSVTIAYEIELEVVIPGEQAIVGGGPGGISGLFPNTIEDHLMHQMEAKATVVGDPSIEEDMNFLIQNVSSAYSGVWYIKKVSHRINQSIGYQCEIDFVTRTNDTIVSSAQVKADITSILEKVQEAAQNRLTSGNTYNENWKSFINNIRDASADYDLDDITMGLHIDSSQTVSNLATVDASSPANYSTTTDIGAYTLLDYRITQSDNGEELTTVTDNQRNR